MSGPNSLRLPPPGLDPFSAPPMCQLPEVRELVTFDRLGFQFTLNDAVYQRCWRAVARDAGATMVQARRAGECELMLNVGDALVRLWTSVKARWEDGYWCDGCNRNHGQWRNKHGVNGRDQRNMHAPFAGADTKI